MVIRDARGFSTGFYKEVMLHRCSLLSSNMVYKRNMRCVKLPGTYARHRSCIAQDSCCIAQSHGQCRIVVIIKRIISPYV